MKQLLAISLLCSLVLTPCACQSQSNAIRIAVDPAVRYQTIEGFGTCLISWDPAMAAYYQKPSTVKQFAEELGLNILRCNLWGDGTIGPVADPAKISYKDPAFAKKDERTPVFIAFAQAVRKINPELKVIGTVWSPPAWMKVNGRITDDGSGGIDGVTYKIEGKGECPNRVIPDRYRHFAKWLTEMARYYESKGVPMYALSPANEPQFTQGFESCVWTASDLAKATELTAMELKKVGLSRIKLFGPETMTGFNWEGGPNRHYTQMLRENPPAFGALGFYATHGYSDGVKGDISSDSSAQFWSLIKGDGKPYWMTEGGTGGHAWPNPVRKGVAAAIHNSLVAGNASAFVPWQFAEAGDSEHALTGLDRLDKKGQVVRQFSRFIPAGSVRVAATPAYGDVNVSAFTKGSDLSVIVINPQPIKRQVVLQLKSPVGRSGLYAVRTSATEDCAKLGQLGVKDGLVRFDLPGDSIVTLTTLSFGAK